ncbi:MAG: cupin domain-containing protein [Bacteroidia bacterium]|nr:cupin domain-containing protein [Bacteroidia bacterium]
MQTKNLIPAVTTPNEGRKLNILGHSVTIKLQKKETEGMYYVMEVITPPGHGIPPHVHSVEDEMIYVLEGEFVVQLGDKTLKAEAGAEIFFPRFVPHAFQNIGTTPGKTLWTIVPGGNFEAFFEELNALPPDREPDMGKVIEIFGTYGMKVLIDAPV